MGGVLMDHDIAGCMNKFRNLLGSNFSILGLKSDGEATSESEDRRVQVAISNAAQTSALMHDYETGRVGTNEFVASLLPLCKPGTVREDILDAWDTMHAGMPQWRLDKVREWHKYYPVFLLSNNNEEHWHHVTDNWDISGLFDEIFLSHLMHVSKPSSEIFAMADNAIHERIGNNYNKAYTIFIDDLEANQEAARHFGWQACGSLEELETILNNEK